MTDLAPLLAHVGGGFFQQAFVVADLATAEASLRAGLGCSEFVDLPASDLDYEVRGRSTTAALAIGFARSGDVQLELIQPVRGESIHAEFLAAQGPGAHHLGYLVESLDDASDLAARCGYATVMSGQFASLRFCYLDTWDERGVYTELVEDPDGMMTALMPWR